MITYNADSRGNVDEITPSIFWNQWINPFGSPKYESHFGYYIVLFGDEEEEESSGELIITINGQKITNENNENFVKSNSVDKKLKCVDKKLKFNDLCNKLIDIINDASALKIKHYYTHYGYKDENKIYHLYSTYMDIDNQLIINFLKYDSTYFAINILANNDDYVDQIHSLITNYIEPLKPKKEENKSYINFICAGQQGYFLNQFEVGEDIDYNNIYDNYEESFKEEFSEKIISRLTDKNTHKGLVLLHGEPGTAKTTYLRYLLSKLSDQNVMYVPPELGNSLSDPAFITFLMSYPNSVLIIEDAENILKTREAGFNQAVSNILNITDGLIGSALKYKVICTFNAECTEIDSALLRKGRLLGKYQFSKLSKERTKFLVKKLYGDTVEPTSESMSVADIYNMRDDMPQEVKKSRSFGFIE